MDFLCHCLGKKVLGPGLILGKDLIFWAGALRFAGALMAKEQFLPSGVKANASFYARWEPVFWGEDSIRLAALARAMPEVCRALMVSQTYRRVVLLIQLLKSLSP